MYKDLLISLKNKNRFFFFLSAVVINIMVIYFRQKDHFWNPQFWAEDGTIFFANAYNEGLKSIFEPYNGYLHLYPRIVAISVEIFNIPYTYAPHFYKLSWFFVSFIIVYYIFFQLEYDNIKSTALATILFIVPVNNDIIMAICNAHWVLSLIPILIVSTNPIKKNSTRIITNALLVIVGLSTINIAFMWPLFLLRLYFYRNKDSYIHFIVITFVTFLQGIFFLLTASNRLYPGTSFTVHDYAVVLSKFFFFPLSITNNISSSYRLATLYLFLILVLLILVYIIYSSYINKRFFTLFSVLASIFMIGASIYGTKNVNLAISPLGGGGRYFFIPTVAFAWAILGMRRNYSIASIKYLLFTYYILFMITFLNSRHSPLNPYIDYRWKEHAKKINTQEEMIIPINPPGWNIYLHKKE